MVKMVRNIINGKVCKCGETCWGGILIPVHSEGIEFEIADNRIWEKVSQSPRGKKALLIQDFIRVKNTIQKKGGFKNGISTL